MRIAIRAVALELPARDAGVALARFARAGRILFAIQRRNNGTSHRPNDRREEPLLAAWGSGAAISVMVRFLAGEFLERTAFGFGDEERDKRSAEHKACEDFHKMR